MFIGYNVLFDGIKVLTVPLVDSLETVASSTMSMHSDCDVHCVCVSVNIPFCAFWPVPLCLQSLSVFPNPHFSCICLWTLPFFPKFFHITLSCFPPPISSTSICPSLSLVPSNHFFAHDAFPLFALTSIFCLILFFPPRVYYCTPFLCHPGGWASWYGGEPALHETTAPSRTFHHLLKVHVEADGRQREERKREKHST